MLKECTILPHYLTLNYVLRHTKKGFIENCIFKGQNSFELCIGCIHYFTLGEIRKKLLENILFYISIVEIVIEIIIKVNKDCALFSTWHFSCSISNNGICYNFK